MFSCIYTLAIGWLWLLWLKIYTYIYIYLGVCVCAYIYIYIYIYIHAVVNKRDLATLRLALGRLSFIKEVELKGEYGAQR